MDREAWLLQSMGSQRLKTRLTKWTELNWVSLQGREFEISKASFRQCRNHSWFKLSPNFPRAVSMNHRLVSKSSLQLIDFHFLLHRFLKPHKHHMKWRGCITICHVPSHCLLLLLLSRVQLFATPQTAGFPVLHCLQFAQTRVHCVADVIQLSHPLSPPSPLALHLSQHEGAFQWIGFSHQVARVLLVNCSWEISWAFPDVREPCLLGILWKPVGGSVA